MRTAVLTAILISLSFAAARGQGPPPVPRAAVEHFQKGRELQGAGRWEEALAEYRAAHALAPRPALLFDMAQCLRKMGDAREALALYQAFVDSEPDGRRIDQARGYIALLREELTERAEPPPPPRPEPPPPAIVKTPPPAVVKTPPPAVVKTPPPAVVATAPRGGRTLRIAALVTGGAGVAALSAGAIFGLRARAAADELEQGWSRATYDAGRAANRDMWIACGAGAAAVAAGVVLYVLSRRDVRAEPVVGPGGAGLSLSGRF